MLQEEFYAYVGNQTPNIKFIVHHRNKSELRSILLHKS
jgi:hypothetical protein